ncbi:VOC family protein [Macrococcoides goetzii]|uniref:VOC family protein n=1 Tax=Macrococcus TaxID=69965 RepID=UPI001EF2A840|nr:MULTISPECIES: glyoxalase/bleomycin resistance/extradiol dioxygenase family protein [Macrococcus]MCG7418867.1 glyoxalase/bleomycin resistance/extradiol dioxygenase family protein [Macrococcus epidermidis]
MIKAVPYFIFHNTLEVLDFYEQHLGAKIISKTLGDDEMFKDMPDEFKMPDDVAKQFVMNAEFEIFAERFMVSDTWGQKEVSNEGTSVCFTFDGNNEEEIKAATEFYNKAIAAGCKEEMPLGQTEWSKLYGHFKDPFGVTWMINAL